MGQWLGLGAYTAGGMGLITGQGTKIPGERSMAKEPPEIYEPPETMSKIV